MRLLFKSLIGAVTLFGGGDALACSVHDHACRFHGAGTPLVPDAALQALPTGLHTVLLWDGVVDLDIHGLLPEGHGPYIATGPGTFGEDQFGNPRYGEPYTSAEEQERHLYYHQWSIQYQNGTALGIVSSDTIGTSQNPNPNCSTTTNCELITIGGNVPDGTYRFRAYNFNDSNVAPNADYLTAFFTTGQGYVVVSSHLPNTALYGSFTATGQLSEEIVVEFGNYGFDPHAKGVTLIDNRYTPAAYQAQYQGVAPAPGPKFAEVTFGINIPATGPGGIGADFATVMTTSALPVENGNSFTAGVMAAAAVGARKVAVGANAAVVGAKKVALAGMNLAAVGAKKAAVFVDVPVYGVVYALKTKNQEDFIHRDLNYMWAYDTGISPMATIPIKIVTELGQHVYFRAEDEIVRFVPGGKERSLYRVDTLRGPGGYLDTFQDIVDAYRGAADRAAGLPPNPPSNRLGE